ncbi:glycosyltransferase family 9 protein [Phenylobacterium sp.]|jgi:tetratricopeptide (TPR) repeat protein|uniref:glycosyltransferase family 9 protein n=1 Tax=Phenylobacterium sp. TaxID=1871053 RepID=UPI002F95A182
MTENVTPAELRRAFLSQLAGDFAEAEAGYRRALAAPALADAARRHLIHLLESQHRWDDALRETIAAHEANPQAPELMVHVATALLGLGRYPEAWPLLEARAALPAGSVRPRLNYPEWDGRPVRSLTLWDELGAGDTIQFARFIPDLLARGIKVTLVVRPELAPLMEGLGAEVIAAQGDIRVPQADAWAMMGSLPLRMGVTLDSLPGRTAYLKATPDRLNRWARTLRPTARIGVVTCGKAAHPNDRNRSLPYAAAGFLLSLPGAENLHPEESTLPLTDFAETAAVVQHLDLVISVDTAVAHLAGALGKPCWVLLPWVGEDWRWLHDGRTDSPWYPSLKLYRQPAPGDWATPLRQIAEDIPAFFKKG